MEKFDVFISFKNTDGKGAFTHDREMAEKLFYALKEKNINAFYSNVSIAECGESHFGKMINEALEQCDIFVAVGSSIDNLKSQWVKYEIETFNNELLNGNKILEKSAMYSFVTSDVRTNKLPMELRRCQSFTQLDPLVNSICKRINNQQEVKQSFAIEKSVNDAGALQIGSIVDGKYEIVKQLGKGGMSIVYLAVTASTGKQWAVKVVPNDSQKNFEIKRSALVAEANLLKSINSMYFPRVVDIVSEADSYIVVMDYVEGQSLGSIINEHGAQPEESVKRWAIQLCNALRELHTMKPSIIYRDLKPDNVMITPCGSVKIIDFGAARQYKVDTANSAADTTVLGTVGYAAPEQYGGIGQTDARTDIYGLGVTLYHALTNKNPSEPPYEILPLREVDPQISRAMEYIVKKCTNRDPLKRYQDVGQIIDDLENMDKLERRLRDKPSIFGGFGAKKPKQEPTYEELDKLLDEFAETIEGPIKTPTIPSKPQGLSTPTNSVPYPNTNGGTIPVRPFGQVTPLARKESYFGETEVLVSTPKPPVGKKVKAYVIIAGKSDFTRRDSTEIRFYLVTEQNKEDMKKAMKLSPEYNNFVVSDSFEIGETEVLRVSVMSFGLYLDKHDTTLSCDVPYDYIIAVKSPYEEATDRYASALVNLTLDSKLVYNVDMTFGLK